MIKRAKSLASNLPLVSVIIPVFNGERFLSQAIESVLSQDYPFIEILVVNDGSKDSTAHIAKNYKGKIRYFYKENGGVSTALNLGIEQAEGLYISWLSHDDLYKPYKIRRQIDELISLGREDVVLYSDWDVIDEQGHLINSIILERQHELSNLNYSFYPLVNSLIHGCTLLIPKKCFERCGLFDPQLRTTQDYDMWRRIFSFFDVRYIPDILISYRLHGQQGSITHPWVKKELETLWTQIIKNLPHNERIKLFSRQDLTEALERKAYDYDLPSLRKVARSQKLQCLPLEGLPNPKVSVLMLLDISTVPSEEIKSILGQTYKNIELILLISNPHLSLSALAPFLQKDTRVQGVEVQHLSLPSALNKGLQKAKGRYITFLEPGYFFPKERIERQLFHMLQQNSSFSYISYSLPSNTISPTSDILKLLFPMLKNKLDSLSDVMVKASCLHEKSIHFPENAPVGYKECFLITLMDSYGDTFLKEVGKKIVNNNRFSQQKSQETRQVYENVFRFICGNVGKINDYEKVFLILKKWQSLNRQRKRYSFHYNIYIIIKYIFIKTSFWPLIKNKILNYVARKKN